MFKAGLGVGCVIRPEGKQGFVGGCEPFNRFIQDRLGQGVATIVQGFASPEKSMAEFYVGLCAGDRADVVLSPPGAS